MSRLILFSFLCCSFFPLFSQIDSIRFYYPHNDTLVFKYIVENQKDSVTTKVTYWYPNGKLIGKIHLYKTQLTKLKRSKRYTIQELLPLQNFELYRENGQIYQKFDFSKRTFYNYDTLELLETKVSYSSNYDTLRYFQYYQNGKLKVYNLRVAPFQYTITILDQHSKSIFPVVYLTPTRSYQSNNSVIKTYYPNGKLLSDYFRKDNKANITYYNEDGEINDSLVGISQQTAVVKTYSRTGVLIRYEEKNYDILHGKVILRDENTGNIIYKGNYYDGKKFGKESLYYKNGNIKEINRYAEYKHFRFLKDRYPFFQQTFYENGKIKELRSCFLISQFDSLGNIVEETTFINQYLNNARLNILKSENAKITGELLNGKRTGFWQSRDSITNKLFYEGYFSNGIPISKWRVFYKGVTNALDTNEFESTFTIGEDKFFEGEILLKKNDVVIERKFIADEIKMRAVSNNFKGIYYEYWDDGSPKTEKEIRIPPVHYNIDKYGTQIPYYNWNNVTNPSFYNYNYKEWSENGQIIYNQYKEHDLIIVKTYSEEGWMKTVSIRDSSKRAYDSQTEYYPNSQIKSNVIYNERNDRNFEAFYSKSGNLEYTLQFDELYNTYKKNYSKTGFLKSEGKVILLHNNKFSKDGNWKFYSAFGSLKNEMSFNQGNILIEKKTKGICPCGIDKASVSTYGRYLEKLLDSDEYEEFIINNAFFNWQTDSNSYIESTQKSFEEHIIYIDGTNKFNFVGGVSIDLAACRFKDNSKSFDLYYDKYENFEFYSNLVRFDADQRTSFFDFQVIFQILESFDEEDEELHPWEILFKSISNLDSYEFFKKNLKSEIDTTLLTDSIYFRNILTKSIHYFDTVDYETMYNDTQYDDVYDLLFEQLVLPQMIDNDTNEVLESIFIEEIKKVFSEGEVQTIDDLLFLKRGEITMQLDARFLTVEIPKNILKPVNRKSNSLLTYTGSSINYKSNTNEKIEITSEVKPCANPMYLAGTRATFLASGFSAFNNNYTNANELKGEVKISGRLIFPIKQESILMDSALLIVNADKISIKSEEILNKKQQEALAKYLKKSGWVVNSKENENFVLIRKAD